MYTAIKCFWVLKELAVRRGIIKNCIYQDPDISFNFTMINFGRAGLTKQILQLASAWNVSNGSYMYFQTDTNNVNEENVISTMHERFKKKISVHDGLQLASYRVLAAQYTWP